MTGNAGATPAEQNASALTQEKKMNAIVENITAEEYAELTAKIGDYIPGKGLLLSTGSDGETYEATYEIE